MEIFYKYVELLNNDLKNSLRFYTSHNYKELNNIKNNDVINNNHYDNILDCFDGAPYVNTTFTVYRGMNKKYIDSDNKTFISTSLNKNIAKNFHSGSSCCLYIITLTPGQYGILPLSNISEMPEEEEILLPPGSLSIQTFVPYTENNENVDIVYCTYIPKNAFIIKSAELNDINTKIFNEKKINLSINSWIDRILDSNIKEEIELLCNNTNDLENCINNQLQTLYYYDDIPEEAKNKVLIIFKNLSNVIL